MDSCPLLSTLYKIMRVFVFANKSAWNAKKKAAKVSHRFLRLTEILTYFVAAYKSKLDAELHTILVGKIRPKSFTNALGFSFLTLITATLL